MLKRKLFLLSASLMAISPVMTVVSCKKRDSRGVYEVANAYYVGDFKIVDFGRSVDLIGFNGKSEIVVPEWIEGRRVKQFGSAHFDVDADSVTSISIGHNVGFKRSWGGTNVAFDNLSKIELIDPLSWMPYNSSPDDRFIYINRYFPPSGSSYHGSATVKLSSGPSNNVPNKEIKKIYIGASESTQFILPKDILSLPGVIIGTQVTSKQAGWEDGWNGNNRVIWGVGVNEFADTNYATNPKK